MQIIINMLIATTLQIILKEKTAYILLCKYRNDYCDGRIVNSFNDDKNNKSSNICYITILI